MRSTALPVRAMGFACLVAGTDAACLTVSFDTPPAGYSGNYYQDASNVPDDCAIITDACNSLGQWSFGRSNLKVLTLEYSATPLDASANQVLRDLDVGTLTVYRECKDGTCSSCSTTMPYVCSGGCTIRDWGSQGNKFLTNGATYTDVCAQSTSASPSPSPPPPSPSP